MLGLSADVITSPRLVLQGRALRSGETWVKFRVFTGGKGVSEQGPSRHHCLVFWEPPDCTSNGGMGICGTQLSTPAHQAAGLKAAHLCLSQWRAGPEVSSV